MSDDVSIRSFDDGYLQGYAKGYAKGSAASSPGDADKIVTALGDISDWLKRIHSRLGGPYDE